MSPAKSTSCGALVLLLASACHDHRAEAPTPCGSCHQAQQAAWARSHHARAMTVARDVPAGRVGDFSIDASLGWPDGGAPLRFLIGVAPLQQVVVGDGALLQVPPLALDGDGTWRALPLRSGEDWLTPRASWNGVCAPCHSTGFTLGATAGVASTWASLDVGCEACHGSATGHRAWLRDRSTPNAGFARPLTPARFAFADGAPIAHAVTPATDAQLDGCAGCHTRRSVLLDGASPADGLFDGFEPELMTAAAFEPSGALKDEVFEVASFSMSRMARAGVRCSHCHEPHTGELRAAGNALCTQCHRAEVFDVSAHRQAQQCVDCHMPPKTFMGTDVRRDHALLVPGRGHSLAETAAFTRAWQGDLDAVLPLLRDDHVSTFKRASAVALLGPPWSEERLEAVHRALASHEPWERFAAAGVLARLPEPQRTAWGAPLLTDELRAMRVRAVRALSGRTAIPERARADFLAACAAQRFHGEGWLQLGDEARARGALEEADAFYAQGLAIDPGFGPLIVNRADILRELGRDELPGLRRGLGVAGPWTPDVAYALGLGCWRRGQQEEALAFLSIAMADGAPVHLEAWRLALEAGGRSGARERLHQLR